MWWEGRGGGGGERECKEGGERGDGEKQKTQEGSTTLGSSSGEIKQQPDKAEHSRGRTPVLVFANRDKVNDHIMAHHTKTIIIFIISKRLASHTGRFPWAH